MSGSSAGTSTAGISIPILSYIHNKIKEENVMPENFNYCVSVAVSYLSLSWKEYFFETYKDAYDFYKEKEKAGYAVLIVDRDEY